MIRICKNLGPFHTRMPCAKFSSSIYFCYYVIIFSWKRAWPFIWTNLGWSSTKRALCHFWLKLVQMFWRRWWKGLRRRQQSQRRWRRHPTDKDFDHISSLELRWAKSTFLEHKNANAHNVRSISVLHHSYVCINERVADINVSLYRHGSLISKW